MPTHAPPLRWGGAHAVPGHATLDILNERHDLEACMWEGYLGGVALLKIGWQVLARMTTELTS